MQQLQRYPGQVIPVLDNRVILGKFWDRCVIPLPVFYFLEILRSYVGHTRSNLFHLTAFVLLGGFWPISSCLVFLWDVMLFTASCHVWVSGLESTLHPPSLSLHSLDHGCPFCIALLFFFFLPWKSVSKPLILWCVLAFLFLWAYSFISSFYWGPTNWPNVFVF